MFKSIISSKRYWVSVLFLGLIFIIPFSVIQYLMEYGGLAFDTFIEEKINNGFWVRYLLSRIVGGLSYGMILGYYFELRKRKSNQ
ncbi:hypothetical protein D1818_10295 [Aquimarina sp. BL5]|uniref:hypothetical protein n=1 Tax=Aquimarina sp. BL5 TaxID=1714860 RepID=UPI000E527BC7|nr:hypothetical protein [Aquimarina sp. BL5]AXT51194.1 hypothetical protein D1818_10295 [Aquimarina sp. BL5]RKN09196.1 hypothetical protein D7036_04395 [Aquimarina sp. BL5]